MEETTRLVIAVDSTQVRSATEALQTLGFQATAAERASGKLGTIEVDSRHVKSATEALKALGFEATLANRASAQLAKASTDAGRSTAAAARQTSGAMREISSSTARAATEIERLTDAARSTNIGGDRIGRGFDAAALEIGRAKNSLIELGDAATSLGASAQVQKFTSALKDSNIAALEAARSMIRLREAEAEATRRAGPIAGATTVPGAGGSVAPELSDAAHINSFSSAMERAERQAEKLGSTLRRSIGSGADSAKDSIDDLSKATTSLGAAGFVDLDKVTTSLGAAASKASEATREVSRLQIELGQLANARTSFGATVGPTVSGPNARPGDLRGRIEDAGVRQAADNQELLRRLTKGATDEVKKQGEAVKGASHAHDGHWKSVRRTAFEQQQLMYQLHDFTVQVVGGQSPFLALVQQGSQLAGTFGGIRGAITAVTALITPTVVAVGSLAIGIGSVAIAMARVESSTRTFNTIQAQLEAIGRAGAFTTEQLRKMVQTLSEAPGVSREAAIGIVSEFSKIGQISPALSARLAPLVADFAKATGKDIPDALRELAQGFRDPVKGAEEFEKALNRLSPESIARINDAMDVGDKIRAQGILIEELERLIKGLNERGVTPLQESTNNLGNAWNRLSHALDDSQGLKRANELLASVVDKITWLIGNVDKVRMPDFPQLSQGQSLLTGAAQLGERAAVSLFGTDPKPKATGSRSASGKVTDAFGRAIVEGSSASSAITGSNAADDSQIKSAMKLGEAYQSLGSQIEKLTEKRKILVAAHEKALKNYGPESAAAKQLGENIAGLDERIKSLGRRGRAGENEAERIADIQLRDRVNAIQDALTMEREAFSVQDRLLQTAYQLGETSLKAFYDRKVEAIRQGTQNQLKAIDDEISALRDRIANTNDPARREQFQARINDLNRERPKIEARGRNEETTATDQLKLSYQQLTDQVENYRVELLRLQGDESAAAEIQAQQAIRRAKALAGQAANDPRLPKVDVTGLERGLAQQRDLNQLRETSTLITARLAIEESALDRAVQSGAASEFATLSRVGEARQKAAAELEKIVQGMEAVATKAENSKNWKLQLETAQAREELEKLKAAMDPLKDKFDDIFKGATEDLLNDVLSGKLFQRERREPVQTQQLDTGIQNLERTLSLTESTSDRDRIRGEIGRLQARRDELNKRDDEPNVLIKLFTNLTDTIARELRESLSKQLTSALFAKDGPLGGLSKGFADLFRPEGQQDPASKFQSTLDSLSSHGVEPAVGAMGRLQSAADSAASALSRIQGGGATVSGGGLGLPTAGDVARADRPIGGDGTDGIFGIVDQEAVAAMSLQQSEAANAASFFNSRTMDAAQSAFQLAQAARSGGNALSLLPWIINTIQAAATAMMAGGGGSSGGGILGALVNIGMSYFSGGMSGATAAFSQTSLGSSGFGTGLAYGNQDYGSFFAKGGYTGDVDPKKIAGMVHGKEYVFSAPAVETLGVEVLEKMHESARSGSAVGVLKAAMPAANEEPYISGKRAIGGPVSSGRTYLVNEKGPELLEVGGRQYLMMGSQSGDVKPVGGQASGGNTIVHVTVTPPPGTSRDSAMQWGATAGRQMQHAMRRNG